METVFGKSVPPVERFRFQLRQLIDTFHWIPQSEQPTAILATRDFLNEIECISRCQHLHSGEMGNGTNAYPGAVEKANDKIFTNLEPITSFENFDLTEIHADSVILHSAALSGGGCVDAHQSSVDSNRSHLDPTMLDNVGQNLDMVTASHSQLIDAVYSEMRHQASLLAGVAANDHQRHRALSEAGSDAFLELSSFAADIQNSAKDLLDPNDDILSKDLASGSVSSILNSFQSEVSVIECLVGNAHHQPNCLTQPSLASNGDTTTTPTVDVASPSVDDYSTAETPQRITRSMFVHGVGDVNADAATPNSTEKSVAGTCRPRASELGMRRTGKRMDRLLAARRQGAKRLKENKSKLRRASSSSPFRDRKRLRRRHLDRIGTAKVEMQTGAVCCRQCHQEFRDCPAFNAHHCQSQSDGVGRERDDPCILCELLLGQGTPHEHNVPPDDAAPSPERRHHHCQHCNRQFRKRPSLYVHMRQHVSFPRVVCQKCGIVSENETANERHQLSHKSKSKFRCAKCNEVFERRQQYQQHTVGHHKYDCVMCEPSLPLATKRQTLRHRRQVHGIHSRQERRHECLQCHARFSRPALLVAHLRVHVGETAAVRSVSCPHCSKRFRSAGALAKHIEKDVHTQSVFAGDDQEVSVSSDSNHGAPFLCAKCGATFYRNQGLIRHMQQRHSEEKKFECPFCDFRCKCKTNLKRHIELHKDEKRFVCELCAASFNAHATLKDHHAYVHSEARQFVCPTCNKGFKGRSGLRRHLRSHSDARPYACLVCNQSYKRMSHLKRHMSALHGSTFKSKRVQRLGGEDGLTDYCLSEDDLTSTLPLADSVLSDGPITALDLDSVQPLSSSEFLGHLNVPVTTNNECHLTKLSTLPTSVTSLVEATADDLNFDDDVAAHLSGMPMLARPLPSMSQLSAGFLSDKLAQFLSMQ